MTPTTLYKGLLAAVVVSFGLGACSPALDWRTVRPEASASLETLFPCKPDRLDRSLQLPGLSGPPVVVHLLSCKANDATWALSYLEVGEVTRVSTALAAMTQAMRDNLNAVAPQPIVAEDLGPANVAGMTPQALAKHWRFRGQRPGEGGRLEPLEVQSWHFAHGLTVYQASVWRHPPPAGEKAHADAVETFAAGLNFSD